MAFGDSVRRSQLIVPFGVGAMIDFPEDTLMTAGLDFWPIEAVPANRKDDIRESTEILDQRLQRRLSSILGGKKIDAFFSPTEGRKSGSPNSDHYEPMPFVRFPTWLTCPRCKVLKRCALSTYKTPRCDNMVRLAKGNAKLCGELYPTKRPFMQPVRFVLACESGHIDDFPWKKWVHHGDACPNPDAPMFLTSTGAPGLAGTVVKCTCVKPEKRRSMEGCFDKAKIHKVLGEFRCTGRSPWLGAENQWQACADGSMQTVQRGSSGIHFSHTISSILIPPYSKSVRMFIDKGRVWDEIKDELDDGVVLVSDEPVIEEHLKKYLERKARRAGFEEKVFIETVLNKYLENDTDGFVTDETEEKYRFREYEAFIGSRPSEHDRGMFDISPVDLSLSGYETWLNRYFSKIVMVNQLKETRVFTGFSRIKPLSTGDPNEARISNNNFNWLPAIETRGEGIFFQFNSELLSVWEEKRMRNGLAARINVSVKKRIADGVPNLTRRDGPITERLLLAHSFSHALIRQLAFECGYDASSLKERLFVGVDANREMCSVLIYTASGDSEGSLGGLVERARPEFLGNTIQSAIREAAFCSNDPVCAETGFQGLNNDNVVACHACNMLPETCCEHSNFLLDRSALVGTYEEPESGFFAELVNN